MLAQTTPELESSSVAGSLQKTASIRELARLYRIFLLLLLIQVSAFGVAVIMGMVIDYVASDSTIALNAFWLAWVASWSLASCAALVITYREYHTLRIPRVVSIVVAIGLFFVPFAYYDTYLYFFFPTVVIACLLACIHAMRRLGFHLRTSWPRDKDIERLVWENDADPFRSESGGTE